MYLKNYSIVGGLGYYKLMFIASVFIINCCVVCVRCNGQDPKIYVQTILDIHKKYNMLVMTAFGNDSGFVESLDKVTLSILCTPLVTETAIL